PRRRREGRPPGCWRGGRPRRSRRPRRRGGAADRGRRACPPRRSSCGTSRRRRATLSRWRPRASADPTLETPRSLRPGAPARSAAPRSRVAYFLAFAHEWGLFSLILRGALLGEGAQALVPVLGGQRGLVALALDRQALVERDVEAAIDRLLGLGDRDRRGAGDLVGEADDGLGEAAGRHAGGAQAGLLGAPRV